MGDTHKLLLALIDALGFEVEKEDVVTGFMGGVTSSRTKYKVFPKAQKVDEPEEWYSEIVYNTIGGELARVGSTTYLSKPFNKTRIYNIGQYPPLSPDFWEPVEPIKARDKV